ncbi:MAG: DUF2306 domain-containing protein [Corynebacterium sp.]|uniref:DUF2306 domain-containing protein n=1 Tax=Corynebacterium sp. TaxID=1720 RepID=UPI0026E0853B|nr:DUF2306 domain-containing protein [Corynebacterium sp.]MDO5670558.1 DUF2306 domain-containing protein [Corynebacterium sp.]
MEAFAAPIVLHASAAFLVLVLGPVNIFRPSRDALHRWLGRTWVALMYVNCGASFLFGLEDGFGFLHGLAILTAAMVTLGVWNIRRGRVTSHRANMIGSYIGTLIAFAFAVALPQRLIVRTGTEEPFTFWLFVGLLLLAAAMWVLLLRVLIRRLVLR